MNSIFLSFLNETGYKFSLPRTRLINGKVIDEKTREKIRELIESLVIWTKRLKGNQPLGVPMFLQQDRLAMDERHSVNESPLDLTEDNL